MLNKGTVYTTVNKSFTDSLNSYQMLNEKATRNKRDKNHYLQGA